MECDAFESSLLDLALREIEGDEASEVRAHVDGCATCRATLAKLERAHRLAAHMPLIDPPATLDAKILAAARAKVGAQDPTHNVAPTESVWGAFLRFLSTFATGPQVAMATVMVLVVTIGIWYVPRMRTPTGGTTVDVDPGGEVGPSSGVEPSPRLELQLDPHARRIRSREEVQAMPARQATDERRANEQVEEMNGRDLAADVPVDDVLAEGEAPAADSTLLPEAAPPPPTLEAPQMLDSVAAGPVGSSSEPGTGTSFGQGAEVQRGSAGGAIAMEPTAPDQGATTRRMAARPAEPRAAAEEAAPMPHATQSGQAQAPARIEMADTEARGDRARSAASDSIDELQMARPTSNTPANATSPPATPAVANNRRPASPAALHAAARAATQRGACPEAITTFETLFSRFPSYPSRGLAMVEAAQCYETLGRRAEATRMLDRAERIPAAAPSARRTRARIQASRAAVSD